MALGYLVWMCIIMSVISVAGLVLLVTVKNDRANRVILYIMAVWGILIAYMNITALPSNWILWRIAAGVCGLVGLAGGIVRFAANGSKKTAASLLAAFSVVAGMIMLFVI